MALIVGIQQINKVDGVADYRVSVHINTTLIAVGTVGGHKRSDGWRALLKKIADADSIADLDNWQTLRHATDET